MLIAVDIETFDPNLKERGDGSFRALANTKDYDGSSLLMCSWWDGERGETCYPATESWARLASMLSDPSIEKVFHNGIYDLSWLEIAGGIEVKGLCHDTMTRAAYIDEYQDLNLDACCRAMGIEGKNKGDTIELWYQSHLEDCRLACRAYGIPFKRSDPLWKHSKLLLEVFPAFREKMAEYNLQDCKATWELYQAQEPLIAPMRSAYMTDVELTSLVLEMKKTGALVDRAGMERLEDAVRRDYERCMDELEKMYGITEEILSSPKKLGERMNKMGAHSPSRTGTGAESWGQGALSRVRHPAVPLILEARGYSKLLNTYLEGSLRDSVLSDGRIHCTFTPNKRDDGGTVTGRFSCSKPNLQQIPARDKAQGHSYGQAMRSLFLPERGCMMSALDYSQIEYLLLAHFAQGKQAEWLREQARAGVDFHTAAMEMTGIPSRKVVKTFNYGVIYGMGWKTALENNYALFEEHARERGEPVEKYARDIYNSYHASLPVIRDTMDVVEEAAKRRGYVITLGGRRLHCPKPYWDKEKQAWNDGLYKMLNKLIQGSAADILKRAMLDIWKAGLLGGQKSANLLQSSDLKTAYLHLTVHDELVFSIPYSKEGMEANAEIKRLMEGSYSEVLTVPMKCDCELGPNWGYWKGDIWEEMKDGKFGRERECWWGGEK